MKLTWASEYAILGLVHLGRLPPGSNVLLSEVSQKEDIPESFLRKIFGTLAKAGLLRSHRGPRGGFSMIKGPKEISLKAVVEAVEGPVALTECMLGPNICARQGSCPIQERCRTVHEEMLRILEQTSVADIMGEAA